MKYVQIFIQIILLIALATTGNAGPTCSDKVRQLELQKENVPIVFMKEVMQLDSRVNKILFLLNHLCETQSGIPLTPLAIYLSQNLAEKGEDKFKAELLVIGKTPQQIDKWFEFCRYAENQISRTLIIHKILTAIDQSIPLIERYVQLAEIISRGGSPEESLQKMLTLTIDVDQLLFNQPYLVQALEETSHVPYWDIVEGL